MKHRSLVTMVGFAAVAAITVFAARAARAGDGVLEINQACVSGSQSCFSDGRTGFPIQLVLPGSYRLTSNITVPDANTDAITMGKGTTLDLGGFSIVGPTSCSDTPAVCAGTGTGVGITVTSGYATIRNGSIRGFGRFGIEGNTGLRVENVVLESNGSAGILSQGAGLQIIGCTALRNGNDGFSTSFQGGNVMLIGNTARGNGADGIDAANALLLDNTAHQNGVKGITVNYQDTDSALARNVASGNGTGTATDQISGGYRFGPNVCGLALCP